MLLAERVAIVTGGASLSGIGFAAARLMANHGATVVIADIDGEQARVAAAKLGDNHFGAQCDVSNADECLEAVNAVAARYGRIDVLLNSAGISQPGSIDELSLVDLNRLLAVNVAGTFMMCQATIPFMKARKAGSIICIGSVSAQRGGGIMGGAHYSASKGAVQSMAKALGRELAGYNIRVNAIAPGLIDTAFIAGRLSEEQRANVVSQTPLGRLGKADDVANTCLYLASAMSAYVTGVVIDVNGGLLIH